ncbi:hypothetical protein K3152_00725 [Qipengyuania sp. 1NDH17]|uniref:SGNH hydrolase-type esterase domain-containing protein n=1 Tax=Qipengyuania polymorpha TaxID=2867234 RepID=A0ABS7IXH1_9SPHN|nr:SGNH/GDSL hydrolase family protein [Qipengyuania polymorpha]MBX7456760.1 hypothetical protein [Qipengyuania polymorpha]
MANLEKKHQADFTLSADALVFNRVFVLGDSLVDSGNALGLAEWYDSLPFTALPEGAPTAEDGYFEGRFTNGYTYADLIANRYVGSPTEAVFPFGYDDPWIGFPIAPFAGDPRGNSLNFAYGGAQIIRGDEFVSGLDEQTDALRDAVDGRLYSSDLVIITMGGNDIRSLAPAGENPATRYHANIAIQAAADELLKELAQLVSRGLGHILITGIPDVGLIPAYDVDGDGVLDGSPGEGGGWKGYYEEYHQSLRASEYSAQLDALIRDEVIPQLEAMGATVHYTSLADVTGSDGSLAFEGALDAVLPSIAALNGITLEQMQADWLDYAGLVFFDSVHPTAQVHALVGAYIHAQMEGTEWIELMPLDESALLRSFSGMIDFAGETDSFGIRLRKGEAYTIEVLGMSTLAADGSLADPWLQLADKAGNVITEGFTLTSGNDSGLGFDASFTFTASASGRYTITVGAEGTLTGSYVVQVGTAQMSASLFAQAAPEPSLDLAGAFEPGGASAPELAFAPLAAKAWDMIDPVDIHML